MGSIVVNACEVILKGLELELTAMPVEGLTLDASYGYTDNDFKKYEYFDPVLKKLIDIADEVHLPQAMKHSLHPGGQYMAPIGDIKLTARVDYAFRSEIYFYPVDRTAAPFNRDVRSRPDHNVSARVALSDIPLGIGKLELGLWGKNLTNHNNIDFSIDFGSLGYARCVFKQPRTYGIDAKVAF